ncbi:hypothetical protein NC796_09050 [Aliifodinibius sp. S!AR15-10]|uniref:hypothetical protein n=1 Tax=Aliifodinibius sp. S!AR15-10 TaxID=2950437 RepID=UPI00286621B9|nr:hypothetical protein [Aliifodinibius sp. S!AR15-10]MDR8391282.1 hypothetical protein [Aliifodinibius sp. S!AR15-10]
MTITCKEFPLFAQKSCISAIRLCQYGALDEQNKLLLTNRGVHFFGEEKMNQKTHHKIPDIVLLKLHSGSCLSTLGDVAGTESRDFLDLGLPMELSFIPPAYGFTSRPDKRSGGVKKETLQ